VNLIRGEPGTEVKLTILREDGSEWEVILVRDTIETSSVEEAMIKGGIAYLQVLSFSMKTTQQVEDALRFFRDAEYQGLIVDLRGNPGGLLTTVVDIADFFFDAGTTVVSTKSRVLALNRTYKADKDAVIPASLPIVVIIDRYSASASEILAGALKDNDRAVIVGESSYGKGTVQEILPKADGGVKLTSSYYLTPSGESIAEVGVAPDVEVAVPEPTPEEKESYRTLLERSLMEEFVSQNPDPGEEDVKSFLRSLENQFAAVPESLIRQYIKDLLNRRNRIYPIYDLEYDTVLQRAVALLQGMIDQ
jgi:carboxyl-terminal processing protease